MGSRIQCHTWRDCARQTPTPICLSLSRPAPALSLRPTGIAAGGGMRTSPSHADMIEAGAIMTAKTFDDPELIKWIAMRVNW